LAAAKRAVLLLISPLSVLTSGRYWRATFERLIYEAGHWILHQMHLLKSAFNGSQVSAPPDQSRS
jgi:hypothetical protein